ncbi:hypothetical protein Tco_0129245, partial [Tanacetum coccineum]
VSVQTKEAARVQLRVIAEEKPLTNQQLGIQNFVPAQAMSGPSETKRYLLESNF